MKTSTFEKLVLNYDCSIPPLEGNVLSWAVSVLEPFGKLNNKHNHFDICTAEYGCNDLMAVCNPSSEPNDTVTHIDCTHRLKQRNDMFFCTMHRFNKEFKVIRTFQLILRKEYASRRIYAIPHEICRHWIAQTCETAVIAKPIVLGKIIHWWPMKIRHKNRMLYDYYADIAIRYPNPQIPCRIYHPILETEVELPPSSTYSFLISAVEQQL